MNLNVRGVVLVLVPPLAVERVDDRDPGDELWEGLRVVVVVLAVCLVCFVCLVCLVRFLGTAR